jgi:hypothetical protein
MAYLIDSKFDEIPAHPEVSEETHLTVIDQMLARERIDLKQSRARLAKARAIEKAYRTKLGRILKGSAYKKFRDFMAKEQAAMDKLMFPPKGPQMSEKEKKRLEEERNKKAWNYLKSIGADPGKLRALNLETEKSMAKLMKVAGPTRRGKPVQVLLPSEVPAAIRTGKTNPWTIETPGYDWGGWWYKGWVRGFAFIPTVFLNRHAGYIGNSNYLKDSSASDWDDACVDFETSIGMWYKMPSAGIIEVYVEAQPSWNQHYCSLYNEWGWSDSAVYQYHYITLQVGSGSRAHSRASYWWENGYASGHWDNRYLTNGATYWFHLYSTGAYAKGAWVFPSIGVLTHHFCFANDVSVYSEMDFRWFIKRVFLRSTG